MIFLIPSQCSCCSSRVAGWHSHPSAGFGSAVIAEDWHVSMMRTGGSLGDSWRLLVCSQPVVPCSVFLTVFINKHRQWVFVRSVCLSDLCLALSWALSRPLFRSTMQRQLLQCICCGSRIHGLQGL